MATGILVQSFGQDADRLLSTIQDFPNALLVGVQVTKADGVAVRNLAAKLDREYVVATIEDLPTGPFRVLANIIYAYAFSEVGQLIIGTKPPKNVIDIINFLNLDLRVIE